MINCGKRLVIGASKVVNIEAAKNSNEYPMKLLNSSLNIQISSQSSILQIRHYLLFRSIYYLVVVISK